MKTEKRTTVDFSKHIILESHYQDGEYNLDVWDFKLPDSNYRHRITFINSCGILAVKGDFGNWIFCREFHPSKNGFVSGGYWDEKLAISSQQESSKYSAEATRKAIEEFEKKHEDSQEDIKDWIGSLKDSVEDEEEYIFKAYRETPRDIDYEDVPFEKERHYYLNVIYDAFDEMCRKIEDKNKEKFIEFISKVGFKKLEDKGWFEKYETGFKPEFEGLWGDGFNIKYNLSYRENIFHIDKVLKGGFFGNTTIDRIFSGVVENEEELATIFKCIKFN